MATPTSGTISIGDINSVFGRGNNLNAYRGTVWYQPNSLVMGYFSSGTISLSDFYNKQPNDPATTGSAAYSSPGTTSFTAPLYRNSLTIYVWGGGGGGGGYGDSPGVSYSSGYYAATGGTSVFYGPNTLIGYGGTGGQTAGTSNAGGLAFGAGGTGGSASGGSTNTAGGGGTAGNAGCIGGNGASGGGGGGAATAYLSSTSAGYAGNFQGGGGGGMFFSAGGKFPAASGGGGGGGFSAISYGPGGLTAGGLYTVVVGGGGAGGPYNLSGGNGANGQVYIVWN